MAFTHDTNRSELRSNQSYQQTIQEMDSEVALPDIKLEIDPQDAAVLIAMAQEAARISSMVPLQQKTTIFRPFLITPTANREALYVYHASVPQEYLESLQDICQSLTSEILITRTSLAFDNIPAFLECLGGILEVRIRVGAASLELSCRDEQQGRKRKHAKETENPDKQIYQNCKKMQYTRRGSKPSS